ncbi:MAG: PKD domain-containing protein, partial [Planctomycetota bacterium]
MMLRRCYFAFVVIIWAGLVQADTITVGSGGPGGGYDYATIQAGIGAANPGDKVLVAPGRYCENINFSGKAITVRSTDPNNSAIVESTIIDGNQPADPNKASVVTFENGEGQGSVLAGFTITNGQGTLINYGWIVGGGIYCAYSADCNEYSQVNSLIIKNCIITQNLASSNGGGIYIYNSSPILSNCTFSENSAHFRGGGAYIEGEIYSASCGVTFPIKPILANCTFSGNSSKDGGGLSNNESSTTLTNCTFIGNSASQHGGALYNRNYYYEKQRTLTLNNCLLVGNSADYDGGAMFIISNGNPIINNCTIVDNSAGRWCGGILDNTWWDDENEHPTLNGCLLWGNSHVGWGGPIDDVQEYAQIYREGRGFPIINYSCIQGWTGSFGGTGNIGDDPLFVYDYHLSADSPCINAGDPAFIAEPGETDIDGEPRIMYEHVDIGADEFIWRPIADAGPDQLLSSISIPPIIILDGSASFDPEGDSLTYHWDQISGPAVDLSDANAVGSTFVPLDFGLYVFELTVSDGVDDSFPDTVSIVIVNQAPVADAGPDQSMSIMPGLITLDGSGSYDPGDDLLTYLWQQINGPAVELSSVNAVNPTFVPLEFGIYVFELVVNDGVLDSEADTVGIVIGNNHAPRANAGPSRYAGAEPIVLDGTGSYDPDGYGEIYQWQQVSGPAVVITGADTATPTISGFSQTSSIQECEFELVVSDGELASEPDIVKVIIVPSFGTNALELRNPPFDPNKPTIVGFGGGFDCEHGVKWVFSYETSIWFWPEKANLVTTSGDWYHNRYEKYGDMLIVYLSKVAPNYHQPIQAIGFSAGNWPAIDVANYLNLTYSDARYAVNRVTLLDPGCEDFPELVNIFLSSSVDGEQCWVDNYMATHGVFCEGALNVSFPTVPPDRVWDDWWGTYHWVPRIWYELSPNPAAWLDGDMYSAGITAGAYVSVTGPAKNLQLAPAGSPYYFKWYGTEPDEVHDGQPDYLLFYDESSYPGRLPEPVTLIGPQDDAVVDANGVVLSCQVSQNAVGYKLLFGPDPYHMVCLVSDTPTPPSQIITTFPFQQTWWTVKVHDQYGSTIYADPQCIYPEKVTAQKIESLTTGKKYDYIQAAIDDADTGNEIVIGPGIYQYYKNINFRGKNVML